MMMRCMTVFLTCTPITTEKKLYTHKHTQAGAKGSAGGRVCVCVCVCVYIFFYSFVHFCIRRHWAPLRVSGGEGFHQSRITTNRKINRERERDTDMDKNKYVQPVEREAHEREREREEKTKKKRDRELRIPILMLAARKEFPPKNNEINNFVCFIRFSFNF